MTDGELVRAAAVAAALCAGAWTDWRTGRVHDALWIAAGAACAVSYAADPPPPGALWVALMGAAVAAGCGAARLYAPGDAAAALLLALGLPVLGGAPTVPPVLLGAAALAAAAAAVANPVLNVRRREPGRPPLHGARGSRARRALAFFLVHPYREGETHAYAAEGPRRLPLLLPPRRPVHAPGAGLRPGSYVGVAVPFLVPMAASLLALWAASHLLR